MGPIKILIEGESMACVYNHSPDRNAPLNVLTLFLGQSKIVSNGFP